MANANWSNPQLTSTYTNFVSEVKNRDEDLALQFDGTTSTNIPTGAIRWDSSANRWKKWSGSAWGELTSTYALTALSTTGAISAGSDLSVNTAGGTATNLVLNQTGIAAHKFAVPASTNALVYYGWNGSYVERFRVDSSGRLGVGTASPAAKIEAATASDGDGLYLSYASTPLGTTGPAISFRNYNNSNTPINTASIKGVMTGGSVGAEAGALVFNTATGGAAPAERLRIDSSGRLLVGTTTSTGTKIEVSSSTDADGIRLLFASTPLGTTGPAISFSNYNNSNTPINTASIKGVMTSGSVGAEAGALVFNTATGGAAPAERLRIDSSGNVGIGAASTGSKLSVGAGNAGATAIIISNTANANVNALSLSNWTGSATTYGPKIGFDNSGRGFFTVGGSDGANNFDICRTWGTPDFRIDTNGNVGIGTTSPTSPLHVNGDALIGSLNSDSLAGTRSRIINGGMVTDQRNTGASISSGVGVVTYSVDRWYVYATGAAVSAQRVTSSNTTFTNALRIIGAASNTGVSIGQRIEVQNSYDMAGRTVTLSFYAASSASVTLTWKTYYAGAANDFTTKTQSNTGTQATTSTLTKYSATFTLSASATTGVAVEFSVASLTSGSIDITGVQLELGSVATPFERRSFGQELALCQRYYCSFQYQTGGTTTSGVGFYGQAFYPVTMRAAPTLVFSSVGAVGNFDTTVPAVGSVSNSTQVSFYKTATATGSGIYSFSGTASIEL